MLQMLMKKTKVNKVFYISTHLNVNTWTVLANNNNHKIWKSLLFHATIIKGCTTFYFKVFTVESLMIKLSIIINYLHVFIFQAVRYSVIHFKRLNWSKR